MSQTLEPTARAELRIGLRGRAASFVFGLTAPLRAISVIARSPLLIGLSALPIAIASALAVLAWRWAGPELERGLEQTRMALQAALASQIGERAAGVLSQAGLWLAQISLGLALLVAFAILAAIIATPFNDLLAEAAESRTRPACTPAPPSNWSTRLRLIRIDLIKSGASLLALLASLVLAWIPLLNLLGVLTLLGVLALQFLSYPQTRRGLTLTQSVTWALRYRYVSLGLGCSVWVLLLIPGASIVLLPLAVVGAVEVYAAAEAQSVR